MMAHNRKKELQDALLTLKEIHIFFERDLHNVVLQGDTIQLEMTVCMEGDCITRGSRVHYGL